jgi:small subunit ribosomal protein S15
MAVGWTGQSRVPAGHPSVARQISGAFVEFVSPKREQIESLQLHAGDTGSAPVQIARLSARIEELTEHLKQYHGDKHTRYGLLQMVGQRSRLLKYLRRERPETYRKVINTLGLRERQ